MKSERGDVCHERVPVLSGAMMVVEKNVLLERAYLTDWRITRAKGRSK